jgi:hypothetical protein
MTGPESLGPCEMEDRCSGGDSNKKAVKRWTGRIMPITLIQ